MSDSLVAGAERFTVFRALGHLESDELIRCSDHLACFYLDSEWKESLPYSQAVLRRLEANAPGAYAYGLARTRYFDDRMQDAIDCGIRQVFLLGAGFDSRSDRFKTTTPISFFEFDRAQVQQIKAQRRREAALPDTPNRVHSIPINFGKDMKPFEVIDFDSQQPLVIFAEGLLYFLSPEFFTALLDFLSLNTAPSSFLVLDYAYQKFKQRETSVKLTSAYRGGSDNSDENFQFTITPEVLENLCKERGLTATHQMNKADMCSKFLCKTDGSLVAQPFDGFNFCTIVREK